MTIQFSKGAAPNQLEFPLKKSAIAKLEPSRLASPRPGNAHGLELPERLKNLTVDSEAYREVMEVRALLGVGKYGIMPWDFLERHWPAAWGKFERRIPDSLKAKGLRETRPQGLASIVHMDSPVDLGLAIGAWLRSDMAKAKDLEARDHTPFLDMVPGPLAEMAVAVDQALERAFSVKYHYGVARPEEVGGMNCTEYPEGCPTHPSFPAGHGAAAGATGQHFIDNWALSAAQTYEVRLACYLWAQFRTLAGVHYAEDNLAGLALGGMEGVGA